MLTLDNTGSTNVQINVANGGRNVAAGTLPVLLMDSVDIVSVLANGSSLALGTITVNSGASNSGNLTITNSSLTGGSPTTVFGGAISDGAGTIALVNTAGFSSLDAANTYTGATTISGGTIKLGTFGSLANGTSVGIAAGATFDLTAKTAASATYTWNAASLSASGTATAATMSGTAGGTIAMGATPITLTTNGTNPSLTVTGAALSLGGNQFTVKVPGSALGAGVYTLVSAASITGTVNPTALYTGGNGLVGGATGVVSISGSTVILTVSTSPTYASWASTHAGSGASSADFDNDGVSNGVEYFMNITTPGFTANPALNGSNTITWTNGGNIPPSAYGTQYVVQTSSDLVNWTNVPSGSLTTNTAGPGGALTYILTGTAPRFVRLKVTPN